jgi:hypothetical protein
MNRNTPCEAKQGKWTSEEDELLRSAIDEHGEKKWKLVSKKVHGRSPIQCLHRWTKILKPGLIKGPWTESEDQMLMDWVAKEGPVKWSRCSKIIQGRNGKQCRERWCNHLDPSVRKGQWTLEEDVIIFNVFQAFGPKWAFISRFLPGRTENSIKNRFYSTVRKIDNRKKVAEEIDKNSQGEFGELSKSFIFLNSFQENQEFFTVAVDQNGRFSGNQFEFCFGQ